MLPVLSLVENYFEFKFKNLLKLLINLQNQNENLILQDICKLSFHFTRKQCDN